MPRGRNIWLYLGSNSQPPDCEARAPPVGHRTTLRAEDAFKSWCWRRLLRGPWTVNPKGNQPRLSFGKRDPEAEAQILWPPDEKRGLIGRLGKLTLRLVDPEVGKDGRRKEKGMPEDEMVRWCHPFNEHEFGPTPGDSGEQMGLASHGSWDYKDLVTCSAPTHRSTQIHAHLDGCHEIPSPTRLWQRARTRVTQEIRHTRDTERLGKPK